MPLKIVSYSALEQVIYYRTWNLRIFMGYKRSRNDSNWLLEQRQMLWNSQQSFYSGLVVYDVT